MPAPPALRIWGEEAVLYDAISGDTHLIDIHAARVLQEIHLAPANIAGLADRLGNDSDASEREALAQALEPLIAEFEKIGVITRAAA